MPQGSFYDAEGNLVWKFDICTEWDCHVDYAKSQGCDCKGDFTKKPCLFYDEHLEMNVNTEREDFIDAPNAT